jgi:hypothetical protein
MEIYVNQYRMSAKQKRFSCSSAYKLNVINLRKSMTMGWLKDISVHLQPKNDPRLVKTRGRITEARKE